MTSVNAELYHREFDPKVTCPRCGYVEDDLDGFGFVYCAKCHECTHPSADGDENGDFYCTVCGQICVESSADPNQ
jgi:predicted RNA-binding Zn-ribbon protein involved in translation (DUF1610 family)